MAPQVRCLILDRPRLEPTAGLAVEEEVGGVRLQGWVICLVQHPHPHSKVVCCLVSMPPLTNYPLATRVGTPAQKVGTLALVLIGLVLLSRSISTLLPLNTHTHILFRSFTLFPRSLGIGFYASLA